MDSNKQNNQLPNQEEEALFSRVELRYSRSKEEVWAALQQRINANTPQLGAQAGAEQDIQLGQQADIQLSQPTQSTTSTHKTGSRVKTLNWVQLSVAAVLVMGLGLGLFARYYVVTEQVGAGQFASITLPGGSVAHLNAETEIKYAPYWWRISRGVELRGEAFFEVEKGNTFTVYSPKGQTQVLGTSFNVYDRGYNFNVFCATGKVAVSGERTKVTLTPGQKAGLIRGMLTKVEAQEEVTLAWRNGKFVYNTTPLSKVFADVARHYNTTITVEQEGLATEAYTGLFRRSETAEEALQIICGGFGLTAEKQTDGSFVISKNQ